MGHTVNPIVKLLNVELLSYQMCFAQKLALGIVTACGLYKTNDLIPRLFWFTCTAYCDVRGMSTLVDFIL